MTRFHLREKIGIFSILIVISLVSAAALLQRADQERPLDF